MILPSQACRREAAANLRVGLLCSMLSASLACDDRAVVTPTATPNVGGFVTDDVARRMSDGEFVFNAPQAPSTLPIIDPARAELLARAYIRTYGSSMDEIWERQHGASIDLSDLRLERLLYAETPYGRLPEGAHPGLRNAYGPYYLATEAPPV